MAELILVWVTVSLVYLIIGMVLKAIVKGEEILVDFYDFSEVQEFLFVIAWPVVLTVRLFVGIVRVLIRKKF